MTTEERELTPLPTLAETLPIRFDNGFFISSVTTECTACNQVIPPAAVQVKGINKSEHSVAMELLGICPACSASMPTQVRFANDGSFMFQEGDDPWVKKAADRPPGLLARLAAKIKMMFRKGA